MNTVKKLIRQGIMPTKDVKEAINKFTDEERDILLGEQDLVGAAHHAFEDEICVIRDGYRFTTEDLCKLCLKHGASFSQGWRAFREVWC